MPLSLMTLSVVDSPVTLKEGLKILERDDYRCQYCGLDGRASFENALAMRVDFVVPRARKGKKEPSNLVACCTPCNTIKATTCLRQFRRRQGFRVEETRRVAEELGIQDGEAPGQICKSIEQGSQFTAGIFPSARRYFSLLGGRLLRPCTFSCGRLATRPSPYFPAIPSPRETACRGKSPYGRQEPGRNTLARRGWRRDVRTYTSRELAQA